MLKKLLVVVVVLTLAADLAEAHNVAAENQLQAEKLTALLDAHNARQVEPIYMVNLSKFVERLTLDEVVELWNKVALAMYRTRGAMLEMLEMIGTR